MTSMTSGYPKQKTSSRGPAGDLPEMTTGDFLADFKGAIRDLGARAENTPAREAVRSVLANLATPHAVAKKSSSTSVRSILKNRPSTIARLSADIAPSSGHSLPPIPVEMHRSIKYKGSAMSMASVGTSAPIPELDEPPTTASETKLSLPPPQNPTRTGAKSSAGPVPIALHPVTEKEEARRTVAEGLEQQLPPFPAASHANQYLSVSGSEPTTAHDRSSSTNTAIEEMETIMSMDSPTTASYLQTNFLSRPHSVITGKFDGPVSAPAHAVVPSFALAQQSTQRLDGRHPLKSSRSTPAFVVANSWVDSRPTARANKENSRPGSAYSYLASELGLPPVPLCDLASSTKRRQLAPQDSMHGRRKLFGDVSVNAARLDLAKDLALKPKVGSASPNRMSTEAAEVQVAKRSQSPQKVKNKPKTRGSTKPGIGDASVKVMRF